MTHILIQLALVFGSLSLLAIGGGSSLLPEMQRVCVERGWIDAEGFSETYSLGQIAPGPPMTMVVLLGYHVAGVAGAAVVALAFFLPACALTWAVGRAWKRLATSPWRPAVEAGLAPISIGFLLAGAVAIGRGSIHNGFTLALALGAAALAVWRNPNPALVVLGCGLLGFLRATF